VHDWLVELGTQHFTNVHSTLAQLYDKMHGKVNPHVTSGLANALFMIFSGSGSNLLH
jgi:hypothetical protein